MKNKSVILSTIVTFIWAFVGGFLLWGILAEDFLNNHLGIATGVPKDPDFAFLAVGCFILALAFTVIYTRWSKGSYTIKNALSFGIWVGILRGFGSGLIDYSTTNILDMTGAIVNGLIYVLFFAIMGAIACIVLKKTA